MPGCWRRRGGWVLMCSFVCNIQVLLHASFVVVPRAMAPHTDAIEAKLSDLRRWELPIELFDHQLRRGARGVSQDAHDARRLPMSWVMLIGILSRPHWIQDEVGVVVHQPPGCRVLGPWSRSSTELVVTSDGGDRACTLLEKLSVRITRTSVSEVHKMNHSRSDSSVFVRARQRHYAE